MRLDISELQGIPMPTNFFRDARAFLHRYVRKTRSYEGRWKKAHDEAMHCLDFEELLAFGLSVYNLLNRLDEVWRLKVHKHVVDYDAKVEKIIAALYARWLGPCQAVLKRLKALE